MSDNNLRQQIAKAQAEAKAQAGSNAIKTGNNDQQSNVKFRPAAPSNYGLNSEVQFRNSRSLSEGAELTDGINFSVDDGEPL